MPEIEPCPIAAVASRPAVTAAHPQRPAPPLRQWAALLPDWLLGAAVLLLLYRWQHRR